MCNYRVNSVNIHNLVSFKFSKLGKLQQNANTK